MLISNIELMVQGTGIILILCLTINHQNKKPNEKTNFTCSSSMLSFNA
jgi:hypothetical protein